MEWGSKTVRFVQPVTVGSYSYVGDYTYIAQNTHIGKYTSVANLCTLGAQNHYTDGLTTWPFRDIHAAAIASNSPTHIGNDVWIGCNAVVISGVTIGHGAVIGAGSVVTRDVDPYHVVVGNPARFLRWRFPRNLVQELLAQPWWDLPHEVIEKLPLLDVSACIPAIARAYDELPKVCVPYTSEEGVKCTRVVLAN